MKAVTLGDFIASRRGGRSQMDVARAAGLVPAVMCRLEARKRVQFPTLRAIGRALKLTAGDWAMAKLLWLESQSGEDFHMATGRRLDDNRRRYASSFNRQVAAALDRQRTLVQQNKLRTAILELLADRRLLRALPHYVTLGRHLRPVNGGPLDRVPPSPGNWKASDGAIVSDELNAYGNFIVADVGRERTAEDEANLRLLSAAKELRDFALLWDSGRGTPAMLNRLCRAALTKAASIANPQS